MPESEPTKKGKKESLRSRWEKLDAKKRPLMTRCEDYARWTIPHVFPVKGIENAEQQGPMDSTGARAVNHMANKLVMTLFPPNQPFFRLMTTQESLGPIQQAAEEGDPDAREILANLDRALVKAEKAAVSQLDVNRYRSEATNTAKSLLITGNGCMYHPENGKGRVQSYSLRDYCVVRDLSGRIVEIMTRDKKALNTFSEEIQEAFRKSQKGKSAEQHDDVTLYTQVKLESNGKYKLYQAAEEIDLKVDDEWPPEDLPWIVLTWNLLRGEDYGRGLVEDYAGAFHALTVLSQAEVDVVAIAADIKFLVNPASMVDVEELNKSQSGTYHTGAEGDVVALQLNKAVDMAMVQMMVERLQRQIAAAFLLNSGVTRDAERVTAEEIRANVNELEMSHGGIYSRFAEEWQLRVATLMLKRIDIDLGDGALFPQIITGLDSLSRAGDLDNLRWLVSDLQLLDTVPEDIRQAISPERFIQYCGVRRGVDYDYFLKTPDEIQAEQQRQMQMLQQQMQMQAGANVAESIGQQAAQQSE